MEKNYKIFEGVIVTAEFGFNSLNNNSYKQLFEFGYYTKEGCVVYGKGERDDENTFCFALCQIELATYTDMKECYWG